MKSRIAEATAKQHELIDNFKQREMNSDTFRNRSASQSEDRRAGKYDTKSNW
jgi:hypothetical protein